MSVFTRLLWCNSRYGMRLFTGVFDQTIRGRPSAVSCKPIAEGRPQSVVNISSYSEDPEDEPSDSGTPTYCVASQLLQC